MKNRRKYDYSNTHDLLIMHIEDDDRQLAGMYKRLIRIEIAQYAVATALALFIFLIDHPKIIQNLSLSDMVPSAMAEIVK